MPIGFSIYDLRRKNCNEKEQKNKECGKNKYQIFV